MGIAGFFGGKGTTPTVEPTADEIALAPFIAAARGIVTRNSAQRDTAVKSVYQELAYSRQVRADYMGG